MTAPFPHRYDVALDWKGGPSAKLAAAPRREIEGGLPPQFDGSDEFWSPEHLLLASAALCLHETYMVLSKKAGIRTLSYRCAASGSLDKTRDGFMFTEIRLQVALEATPEDQERAVRTLESAKRFCIVANSLKTPVVLELTGPAAASSPGGMT